MVLPDLQHGRSACISGAMDLPLASAVGTGSCMRVYSTGACLNCERFVWLDLDAYVRHVSVSAYSRVADII